jgi:predicted SprT family Zn-dependent metalloprotease
LDQSEAKDLAIELMREHGLTGWSFALDHAFRRFGSCDFRRKRITLSRKLVALSDEAQVRNTILHEIAHALTPGQAHNEIWRAKSLEIGSDGKRCYGNEVSSPPPKYRLFCPSCDIEVFRYRRHRGVKLVCVACCNKYNGGRVTKRYAMEYETTR